MTYPDIRPFQAHYLKAPRNFQPIEKQMVENHLVCLEIGAGKGKHACLFASNHPNHQLIAVERTAEKYQAMQKSQREAELENLEGEYDVIALAHSEYTPTLEWVKDNLKGNLRIGFSTPQLRDYFKVVGQPITIVLDTNGEIIFRDFGEIKFTNF